MTREFRWPVRVYIEDTDAGGIVYYVNYLKYLERARTEFMRARGFGKAAFVGDAGLFVVRDVQIRYRSAARLDDELDVGARLIKLGAASLVFQQQIHRGEALIAEAEVEVACVDGRSMKPMRLPADVRQALSSTLN